MPRVPEKGLLTHGLPRRRSLAGPGGIRRPHQDMVNLHSMVKLQPFSPVFRFSAGDFMAGAFQRLSLWNSKE